MMIGTLRRRRLLALAAVALAALSAPALLAAPLVAPRDDVLRPGVPLTLRLLTEGEVRALRLELASSGRLVLWACSADSDPRLTLHAADGHRLAEDDDSGGAVTAWLDVEVEGPTSLTVEVSASVPGTVELLCHLLGDDEASQAAAAELAELRLTAGDLYASGRGEEAGARLRAALAELRADPRRLDSPAVLPPVQDTVVLARNQRDETTLVAALATLVALRSHRLPPSHVELLVDRFDLARALIAAARYAEAVDELQQVLAGMAAALPADHPYLVVVRRELVVALRDLGDLQRALPVSEELLADLRHRLGSQAPETLVVAMDHSEVLELAGCWEQARDLAAQTLPRLREVVGEQHEIFPLSLLRAARPRYLLGDLQGAEALQREALRLIGEQVGTEATGYQVARLHLAQTLRGQGDLLAARELAEAAIAAYGDSLPADHPDPALARGILAGVLLQLGDFEAALQLQRETVARLSSSLAASHPNLIDARSTLAHLAWMSGDLAGASALYAGLAGVYAERPEDDLARLEVQLDRGELAMLAGDAEQAATLQRAALAVLQRSDRSGGTLLAMARRALAASLARLEQFEQAAELYRGALDGLQARLPDDDQDVLFTLAELMEVEQRLGHGAVSRELARELARRLRHVVSTLASAASPRELESMVRALDLPLSALIRVALRDQTLAGLAFECCEALRGVGLSAANLTRAAGDDEALASLRDAIRAATLTLVEAAAGGRRSEVAEARAARDRAQRALAEQLAARGLVPVLPKLAGLAAGLGAHGALFSAWQFATVRGGPVHLLGAVLRCDGALRLADLGPVQTIAREVACWRAAVGVPSADPGDCASGSVSACGEVLARRLLTPLASSLEGTERLALSVDGPLHLLPLDVLPWGEGLLGEAMIVRWRSGPGRPRRAVTAPGTPREAGAPREVGTLRGQDTLLVVGGLDYGVVPDAAGSTSAADATAVGPGAASGVGQPGDALVFAPLPASADELDGVVRLFEEAGGGAVRRLEGAGADKASLTRSLAGATTVQLTTHAWSRPAARAGVGLSPLLLTGLALSGANAGADGLLTAEELAACDLGAAELVVLSGCATNTGEPRTWQGLASLRKAAQLAGAANVLASLWPVDDHWTAVLMQSFYRGLWLEQRSPEEALWQARQEVRAQAQLPRHWAGWVLARSGP